MDGRWMDGWTEGRMMDGRMHASNITLQVLLVVQV